MTGMALREVLTDEKQTRTAATPTRPESRCVTAGGLDAAATPPSMPRWAYLIWLALFVDAASA
jgi:hypothetical protein